jgi:hypothetical protein
MHFHMFWLLENKILHTRDSFLNYLLRVCPQFSQRPGSGQNQSHFLWKIGTEVFLNADHYLDLMNLAVFLRNRNLMGTLAIWWRKLYHVNVVNITRFIKLLFPIFSFKVIIFMGLQPFCWTLAPFSIPSSYTQSVGRLERGIRQSQGRYLHIEQHKHRINAHRHPLLEWDSNTRHQYSSGEVGSRLRQRSYCDRPRFHLHRKMYFHLLLWRYSCPVWPSVLPLKSYFTDARGSVVGWGTML